MLTQSTTRLSFDTAGRGLTDITRRVGDWVRASGLHDGLLTLFLRHTSASLLVQENADPDVRGDLERFLRGWFATATRCSSTAARVRTTCRHMFGRR